MNIKTSSTDPISLIPRYINELGLDAEVERLANSILKAYIDKFSVSGKDPKGLCAGAIYLANKIKDKGFTQQHIADIIGITEVTLRSRYKELKSKLKIKI